MSKTISYNFKLTADVKKKIDHTIKLIMKEMGISKADTLEFLADTHRDKLLTGKVEPDSYIPPNIMDAINNVACDYLFFGEDTFKCLEKFGNSKKENTLGFEPELIQVLCAACKKSKADAVQREIEKEKRKESFKKMEAFLKQFMVITEKGFMQQAYLCTCNYLDGKIGFSRDSRNLVCPLRDDDIISIPEICMKALNPKTAKTPCQYLITLDQLIKVDKETLKTMDIALPTFQYEEPETPEPIDPQDVSQEEHNNNVGRKTIEVESTIVIPDICPECQTELQVFYDKKHCSGCGWEEKIVHPEEDEEKKEEDEKEK